MDYAKKWYELKQQEVAAQTERRELEDKMKFEGYTHPNLQVRPSITKYFELSNDEYKMWAEKGMFEIEYKPNWKAIKENEEAASLHLLVMQKEGRPTYSWKETKENEDEK
jgi:hypothetical protein